MNALKFLAITFLSVTGMTVASPLLDLSEGISPVTSAHAQSARYMSCGELWYARNAIYASQGYCFKTRRAQNVFGRRCYPPYGRLSNSQQRRVNNIVYWERRKDCR